MVGLSKKNNLFFKLDIFDADTLTITALSHITKISQTRATTSSASMIIIHFHTFQHNHKQKQSPQHILTFQQPLVTKHTVSGV